MAEQLAVNVTLLPLQNAAEEGETDTTGAGFTVTVTDAVLVQPFPSVPVTV